MVEGMGLSTSCPFIARVQSPLSQTALCPTPPYFAVITRTLVLSALQISRKNCTNGAVRLGDGSNEYRGLLTFVGRSISAPSATIPCTISRSPALQASTNGDHPFCTNTHTHTHNVTLYTAIIVRGLPCPEYELQACTSGAVWQSQSVCSQEPTSTSSI